MKKRALVYLVFFLVSLQLASAATLTGTIYDYQLNPLENTLIEIEGSSSQQFLVDASSYSIELDPGVYTLTARWADLSAEESITINGDTTVRYDLFLFPDFADEDDLWDDLDGVTLDQTDKPEFNWNYLLAGMVILIIAFIIIVKDQKKEGKKESPEKPAEAKEEPIQEEKKVEEKLEDDDAIIKRVISLLKAQDGRMSQKDLRKELMDLSEAKVSLILTELVHKDRIEKIKKGRGNIIILKKN